MDLSNEVLSIDFGQGAAKISEVKVGGWKMEIIKYLSPIADNLRLLLHLSVLSAKGGRSITT